ncbi:MAG: glycosyltransferase family 2 protein [Alphaproteobacteria bacterium]|nr:glycosyltransferase family 2 protein [Alphaproteobacteria bacterium]
MECPKLNIVVPCYNEEEMLPKSAPVLERILTDLIKKELIAPTSLVCFVNDGSRDKTLEVLKDLTKKSARLAYVSLSRNFGHQSALLAGLFETKADIYVTIDADLQDDPEKIGEMVQKYLEGNEIVYGVRTNRDTDSWFKEKTARLFYRIQEWMGIKTVYNAADFRLMSKRAVETLKGFREKNLFLRGIIHLLGFQSAQVFYPRASRAAGETKYPFFKMFSFALNGIVGFSIVPIRLVTIMGMVISFIGFLLLLWSLYRAIVGGNMAGWASLFSAMMFFNGIIIFSLGVIGEYIGKIFTEVKGRPLFIVDQKVGLE